MSDLWSGPIPALLLLLLFYGWLSRSMAALSLLNESRLRQDAEDGVRDAQRLLPVLDRRETYLQTLQMCKTMTALLVGAIAGIFLEHRLVEWIVSLGVRLPDGLLGVLCIGAVTGSFALLMYLACSRIPRRLAEHDPRRCAARAAGPIRFLTRVLHPVHSVLMKLSGAIVRLFGLHPEAGEGDVTEDDILLMVDRGEESGAIEETEKELIENIFEFNNRRAGDVMTHRTDVTALWIGDDDKTVMDTIRSSGLSRFPVYDKDMDDVVGILSTRDYLLNARLQRPRPMKALLRSPYFVPETVQADILFRDMQRRKTHMAVVIDEYGGVSGIVTLEDLLEEIVGNIYDEFDPQQEADIVQTADNLWRISGATPLEDIEEILSVRFTDLEDEDYDTLGGLVFAHLTTIPADGSHPELEVDGLHIMVERLSGHRVETALVSKVLPEHAEGEAPEKEPDPAAAAHDP